MESLIYSFNATIPVFIIMIVGYVLRRIGMLNDNFVKVANTFNFHVTLPVLLFTDIAGTDIRANFDGFYVLFCAVATSIAFWTIWGLARRFLKDRSMIGAFVQASYRSSAAVLGIAFIQNIYGDSGMAPLMIIGGVPLFNIYAVLVLTFEAEGSSGADRRQNLVKALKNIATNPIIWGILLGVAASYVDLRLPKILDKSLNSLAVMSSPLALIAIGAGFEGRKALQKIRPTIAASVIKLVILPAIFIPLAVACGFLDQKLVALLVMLGAPTTPSSYIMAQNMKNDGVLTSSVIVLTTLLSAVTLTFWIFICRYMGYIQ